MSERNRHIITSIGFNKAVLSVLVLLIFLPLEGMLRIYMETGLLFIVFIQAISVTDSKPKCSGRIIHFSAVTFIFITLLYFFIGKSTASFGNDFDYIAFMVFGIEFVFISIKYPKKEKVSLANYVIIVETIACIFQILIRALGVDGIRLFGARLIDRYSSATLAQDSFLVSICLITVMSFSKNIKKRAMLYSCLLINLVCCIFVMQRATYILLLILYIPGNYLIKAMSKKERSRNTILWLGIYIVVGLILLIFGEKIIQLLISAISSERLIQRFTDISNVIYGQQNVDDTFALSRRVELIEVSFNTFISSVNNFLFGVGDHRALHLYDRLSIGIGGHSDMFDFLAKFGILGGLPICLFMVKCKNRILDENKLTESKVNLNALILVLIYLFVFKNLVFAEQGVIVFFLVPFIGSIIDGLIDSTEVRA